MSTITLPNIRVSSDLTVKLKLKDGGVALDWSTLQNIKVSIYSDAQRALAGRCGASIDAEDPTLLVCTYAANKPQYVGVNRVVVSAKYMGETKTYDKPAFNFVRWTDDQAGEQITIDDPDIDVEIEVEDVSSSILQAAIAAALQAAEDAEHAAHLVPLEVLQDCEQATQDANEAAAAANAAGITSVQVSVEDNEPGTPSAECSLANKVLSVIFHYLKGETGDAAGFGTITATCVEDGGDPSVLVTLSGPDTAKNIAFTLKNFKGDKGDKGDQGNTGSSVDYPFEIVNNCTTDDATKALSAAQGKALKDEVSQLEAEVGEFMEYTDTPTVNLFDKTAALSDKYINKNTGAVSGNAGNTATDFIPIDSRGLYCNYGFVGGVSIGCAVYNSSKQYIRAGDNGKAVTFQEGDAYVRFTIMSSNIDATMVVAGTADDVPAEYVPFGTIRSYSVKDDTVPFDAIAFKAKEVGKNKLNPAEIVDNKYVNRSNGSIGDNTSTPSTSVTGFIPVSKKGLYFNAYFAGGVSIGAAVYDSAKHYIREAGQTYIYQDGDAYVRYSLLTSNKATAQVEEGSTATAYEAYTEREVINPAYIPNSPSSGEDTEKAVNVVLPTKLYAVVGDTLQVFFKQCVQAVEPLKYNILVACSKGKQYHRYFEYTPTDGDVGEVTFRLYVKNDFGEIVGNGSCKLVTVAIPTSPATSKNVLCIGDSLTANGKWPAEVFRRLTGSGGTPVGDGLTNISFVGSMTKDGAGYLGKSGWAWSDYCTEGRPAFRFTVGVGVSVNVGAVYSNNSHNYTVIELSDNGTILCSAASSSDTPQASGTLTKVSGGGDATIAYSAVSADSQNPFWDYDNNKLTFVPYVNTYCGGNLDVLYVLLGGNGLTNWKNDFSSYVSYMEDFADTLHAEYPSAKLVLMGMQFPSMELMMPGYGASGGSYADTYGILVSIARLRELYKKFAARDEYKTFVTAIDIGCQFDGDYNYPTTEKAVNTRNTNKTEPYDNNALHPGDAGYMQYADAVYRHFVAEFCQS